MPDALLIDLLSSGVYRQLAARPERLEDMVRAHPVSPGGHRQVIIDEVQKVPALLDEAHRLIAADPTLRFVFTGSSARRLRAAGTNLLGGRATRLILSPIVTPERDTDPSVGARVSLQKSLQWGGLPPILTSSDPRADLLDYVGLYLQEEIRAEGIARSMQAFARFLEVASAGNTAPIVFARVAQDAEVPARTVRDYFEVLEDTLIGHQLPAFRGTRTRKAVAASKFYLFDLGVAHALAGRFELQPATREFGEALEHLVCVEVKAALAYQRVDASLAYWRSLSQLEVDFVIERSGLPLYAIEVKATRQVERRDLRGLRALREDFPELPCVVVSQEPLPRRTEDGIDVLPLPVFLERLWAGRLWPSDASAQFRTTL